MDDSLNRDQLIALVRQLLQADVHDEDERGQILDTLQEQLLDPQLSDYIFWPDREMTAENIVDRARAYMPISLNWLPEQ
ncbi:MULTISPECIES: hypothetical protein [Deinococcus]|uniref:Colicin immunity protein n=1 Tax=Deinococcus soli (ex Cha et al. 2016) TaxID=1309411 RepID=A0A0F7JM79_9DEIO|nr:MULTISPECIES: hypothetical protein [Deinococcus]AKH16469.1 hypothetical protein SY84_04710 [Deinococcus soli (ex Cha et al. 2016)]MDK2010961.1 hypothetical protein [Deinococcus sp. 43]GGB54803.1 hypothetical protein GCM10008019_08150 [Deinococcus soli (ex Cha et al. 2016)]